MEIIAAGEQAQVPLLAGWNAAEVGYQSFLGQTTPSPESFARKVRELYGDRADEVLKLYRASTVAQTQLSATALASDRFIVYSTWKWLDLHIKTGGKPVYRYVFDHPRPGESGAAHAIEIEYAMGNLATNKVYKWTADDYRVERSLSSG